uniref:MFS transporter n=1 Tax=Steinernema glaseri TaxID=37863 RepID=A0A1I8ASF6_9BILA
MELATEQRHRVARRIWDDVDVGALGEIATGAALRIAMATLLHTQLVVALVLNSLERFRYVAGGELCRKEGRRECSRE